MGEGADDGASSDPSEHDSVAVGAAETVDEDPNDGGKRPRGDHEGASPAKMAKACPKSPADNADGAPPPGQDDPNEIVKRSREADEGEEKAKKAKVSQESPADIAEDAVHPEASKSPSQVSPGGAVVETLDDQALAVPIPSEKEVLINAQEIGRCATRNQQAEDGVSGHGSAGGIVQHNASAHSLPNVPNGGVGLGCAESGSVQRKSSDVLFELLNTAKGANACRTVMLDRLKSVNSELAASAVKKDFLSAAKLKKERDEIEKTLGDIDLVRAEQKKMVEEHISLLAAKEEYEAAHDLQQAWEVDQARFERERAARQGVQPSPSVNSVSATSSSGPASATSAPVVPTSTPSVPKAAHVAPGAPAPLLQNGLASSSGVLETTDHLAHQGTDVISHNIRLEQVQFMCSGQLQNSQRTGQTVAPVDGPGISDFKGKGKGKNKGKGKAKQQKDGRFQSAYFGCPHRGSVIQIKLEGVQVDQLTDLRLGECYDITHLKPRAGQDGIVLWTERTTIAVSSADSHPTPPADFPYQVDNPYQCGTMTFFSEPERKINDPIHMVMKVTSVEEKITATNEGFLLVYGNDMWMERVGPLRMWRFTTAEVWQGMLCIIRGLKVAEERIQDQFSGAWYPDPKGNKKLECTPATAVEDITGNAAISQLYR